MPCEINCVPTLDFAEAPEVEPYGDISGVGVLIGFLTPAYVCLIIITIYYILEHDPEIDPYRSAQSPGELRGRPNPIDQLLYRWFHGRKTSCATSGHSVDRTKSDFSEALSKCVLSLADVQIVAGLGILISGYIALPQCLQLYHWQIVVLLAWFSTITHLGALTFLRNYFYTHPRQRVVRLVLMAVILVLLVVALIPLSDFESTPRVYNPYPDYFADDDKAHDGEHAICYLSYGLNEWKQYDSFATHLILLVYGSLSRGLKLFPLRGLGNRVRGGLAHVLQQLMRWARKRTPDDKAAAVPMFHVPVLAAYVAARFYLDYFLSVAAEIHYLWFALAWGSHRVISLRIERGPEDENTWTFGQVVPVILLLGPMFALWDTLQFPLAVTSLSREGAQSTQSGLKNEGIFFTVGKLIKEAWHGFKASASDFPLWSRELRERRLRLKQETTLERSERIAAFLDSQLHHEARPLWYNHLFIHIMLHWLSAVFVIIKDGINLVNRSETNGRSAAPFTQMFLTPPFMVVTFLWISYLAEIYAWGAASVMMALLATSLVVATAYPWWEWNGAAGRSSMALYRADLYLVVSLCAYLVFVMPLWYGTPLCIDLVWSGIGKMVKGGVGRAAPHDDAAVELAGDDHGAAATHLLPGSSRPSAPGDPSTSDLDSGDLGNGRGAQHGN